MEVSTAVQSATVNNGDINNAVAETVLLGYWRVRNF